MEWFEFWTTT